RARLPVPTGVCVTTEAYRRVAASGAMESVLETLAGTPPDDAARLARLAGEAREIILRSPVPDEVAAAIASGYGLLGAGVPVAVRSSATAEDLPFASFA